MHDFSKLRYRIDQVPDKTFLVDSFPELLEHKEFSDVKFDKILRIAILATDEGSPFVKLEREDYDKRLIKIFEHLKIKDQKLLEKISAGEHSHYESMVNRYFMFCDNLAYVMWSNKLRMFHYIGIALRQPMDKDNMVADMEKRAKLDAQLQTVYTGLLDYESQVFTDIPTRKKLRKQVAKLLQPAEQYSVAKQVV